MTKGEITKEQKLDFKVISKEHDICDAPVLASYIFGLEAFVLVVKQSGNMSLVSVHV